MARQIILDGIETEASARYVMSIVHEMLASAEKAALSEVVSPGKSRDFLAGRAFALRKIISRIEAEKEKNWKELNDVTRYE